jgi:hypothetical protein
MTEIPATRPDYEELSSLLVAAVLDDANDQQVAQLNQLLLADAGLRAYAVQFFEDEVVLRQQFQLCGRVGDLHNSVPYGSGTALENQSERSYFDKLADDLTLPAKKAHSPRASKKLVGLLFALAASVLLLSSTADTWTDMKGLNSALLAKSAPLQVGVLQMRRLSLSTSSVQVQSNKAIRVGDVLIFENGLASLNFSCGVQVFLRGPAEFEIVSPMRTILRRGSLTARVEESAHGFRVDTPNSQVTDLGTEFGVSVDENGETDMVVFSGKVAWEYLTTPPQDILRETPPIPVSSNARLLTEGEAMRVTTGGELKRLSTVRNSDFPLSDQVLPTSTWDPVIESVSDNLREGDTAMCYRVVHQGFAEDARAFVDRPYEWNGLNAEHGLPNFLRNADYVMPFCDDKLNRQLEMRTTLNRPARVFVLIDNRVELPQWLLDDFQDTQYDVGVDESERAASWQSLGKGAGLSVDKTFSVWFRDVTEAATIVTGPLKSPTLISLMYCIAVVPLDVATQIDPDPLPYHQPHIGSGHIRADLLPSPQVDPVTERVEKFADLTVATPAATDTAGKPGILFKLETLDGQLLPHKLVRVEHGILPVLNDGLIAQNSDDLERNVWFDGQGRFGVDLLKSTDVAAVNVFSCHRFERAPQFFTLWGSNSAKQPAVDFVVANNARGWEYIGMAHTHQLGDGGVHASSFRAAEKPLGPYRHLLWITEDIVNGTFFTEIDIHEAE